MRRTLPRLRRAVDATSATDARGLAAGIIGSQWREIEEMNVLIADIEGT